MSDHTARPDPLARIGPDGRYELVREVGSGSMGTVFEARDTVLNRSVAVKLIDRRLALDPVFRQRFVNEAELLARISGRSLVQVYDFGITDDGLFLVTQFLPEGDLGGWIRHRGALSPRAAALLVADVCDALEQVHRAGIVHRDVKPGNVLVRTSGGDLEGYLCDFGIARPVDSDLTATGQVLGTMKFMPPERHRGEPAAPAGDVYAAGCVLWCALTGSAPYEGTELEMALGHLSGPLPALAGSGAWQARFNEILATSMAKDPSERFASAQQMAAALRSAADLAPGEDAARPVRRSALAPLPELEATSTRPTPGHRHHGADASTKEPPADGGGNRRRGRGLALALAALLVVLLAGGAGWAVSRLGDDPSSTTAAPPSKSVDLSAQKSSSADPAPPKTTVEDADAPPPSPKQTRSQQPRSTATTSVPAAPTTRWRCTDGSVVAQAAGCPTPRGAAGMSQVFPDSPQCALNTRNPEKEYSLQCDYGAARGYKITYSAWPSHQAALDHYNAPEAKFSPAGVTATDWVLGGENTGLTWKLVGRYLKASFLYDTVDYSVSISGYSVAGLDAGITYVQSGAARSPSMLAPQRIDS